MEQKKITQGDLVSMFLRSNLQQASFNFERIHGLGFCYDMIPAIKRPLRQYSGAFVIFLYFQCSAAGNEVVRPAAGLP